VRNADASHARSAGSQKIIEDCPFGSSRFLDVIATNSFDLLCHHAARTGDYRNAEFDVTGVIADNTHNLPVVLKTMLAKGLAGVVVTGSAFEQDEGAGNAPLRAFSPYGLSKGLTWQYQRFLSERCTLASGNSLFRIRLVRSRSRASATTSSSRG
jgi:UDP-glucose 4-epimerase